VNCQVILNASVQFVLATERLFRSPHGCQAVSSSNTRVAPLLPTSHTKLRPTPLCFVHKQRRTRPHRQFAKTSDSDSVNMRSSADLPDLLLTRIFDKLKLTDTAGTPDCVARVCNRWAKVAAAARVIQLDSCSSPGSLQLWLRRDRDGVHTVKAIEVMQSVGVISSLPCPMLQYVTLRYSSVDLRPGSQLLQDLSAATGLTHLKFIGVTFEGEPDLAALLSALPSPLHLYLSLIKVQDNPQQPAVGPAQGGHAGPQPLWSAADGFKRVSDGGMQFLCTVTQLKALQLDHMQDVSADGLVGLDNLIGLEKLVMWNLSVEISLSASPGFSCLTALTTLMLHWDQDTHNQFDPSVLAQMRQLKHLALLHCTPARGAAGAAELLCCLAHMSKLEELKLFEVASLEECPPALLSSVTAHSSLRSLVLWGLW